MPPPTTTMEKEGAVEPSRTKLTPRSTRLQAPPLDFAGVVRLRMALAASAASREALEMPAD